MVRLEECSPEARQLYDAGWRYYLLSGAAQLVVLATTVVVGALHEIRSPAFVIFSFVLIPVSMGLWVRGNAYTRAFRKQVRDQQSTPSSLAP